MSSEYNNDIVELPSENDYEMDIKDATFRVVKSWPDYCGKAVAGIVECLNCKEQFCFHTYTGENISVKHQGWTDVLVLKCSRCGAVE